ncbi:MAG: hypothetical protein NTX97_09550 [Bacteroidetes bacterium]|nr:hypothetical protein [Bacteroidota bacterium]
MMPNTSFSENKNSFLRRLPYFFIFLFSVILAIGMYYHEMWRDELEIYAKVGYNSDLNIGNSYAYLVYHFLMKVFLLVNDSQLMYQFYHYVIIVAAIFLLNKYSPFTLVEKFFITFSYFFFYEYGVISRHYGFMVLMVFLILYFLSSKKINFYLLAIPLIILANLGINALIIAFPLLLYAINILYEKFKNKTISKKLIITYLGVFSFFILMGILYIVLTYGQKSRWDQHVAAPFFMNVRTIWNVFVPLPELSDHANFWNTNYFSFPEIYPIFTDFNLFKTTQNIVLAILSVAIFIIILIKFSKKPIVFSMFLVTYILLLLFFHAARFYYIRHQGLLFIVFIYCYWLYYIDDTEIHIPVLNRIKLDKLSRIKIDFLFKPMLAFFLISQFVSSSFAFYKDFNYKFSLSQEAANFIKSNSLEKDHVLIGYMDYAAQAVAINLKEKIYFPQSNSVGYVWEPYEKNYNQNISMNDVLSSCIKHTEQLNKKVVLILNTPLVDANQQQIGGGMLTNRSKITLLRSFTGDIIQTDEQFWLYEVALIQN